MSRAGILDPFIDPTDGQFDTSDWLLNKRGFLPVPIIITEPAVGCGGGAALLFFHRKPGHRTDPKDPGILRHPPSVTGVVGIATENGTWGAGGMHFGSWREDSIRYLGGAGYANVNVAFYRGDRSANFNLQAPLVDQDLQFRLGESDFFLGAHYRFLSVKATLEDGPFPAGGGGLRYLIARKLGLETGVDVARGPETTAFYIVVGSAW